MLFNALLPIALLGASYSQAKVLQSSAALDAREKFDFIVVGCMTNLRHYQRALPDVVLSFIR